MRIGLIGTGRIGRMHASNLAALNLPGTQPHELLLTDAVLSSAQAAVAELGTGTAVSLDELFAAAPDALLIAAATGAHRELIERSVEAGIPVFCEKPIAGTTAEAAAIVEFVNARGGMVQIGHQRRFDPGYRQAKAAMAAGKLGWLHSFRAITADVRPPSLNFIAGSGGIFRDCSVHDFDIIRWLTGQEIIEVYARGSNRGEPGIGAAGDVDTAVAILTLSDGTLGTVTASRYNGGGHDVRLELQGSEGSLAVGLDEHLALRSAEPHAGFPHGVPHLSFMERFAAAYREQLTSFLALARGTGPNLCPPSDALAAFVAADAAQESLLSGGPVSVISRAQQPTPAR